MSSHKENVHYRFIEIANDLSPDLAEAIDQVGVLEFEPENSLSLAHHMCRSVTGQQLSVKAAKTIWNRVLEAADGALLTDFFIEENVSLLHSCGLSKAKARTVCGIAERSRQGGLEASDLLVLNHAARSQHLTSLWGVGQWTADMISIFYFGDEDVWPDGDLAARKTLEKLTSRRRKTVRTAKRFAPYRSYLALYMWEYLDAVPT